MKSIETSLQIHTILFDNTDTKVLINGETFKEHLSYHSQLFISFSELNQVLNLLQQQNPGVPVSELFEEEHLGEGFVQHCLDARILANTTIDLNACLLNPGKKQIRA